MGLPRSTYYDAPPVKTDDAEIVANITAICDEFEAYGYRRVGAELRHRGMVVNSKKIRRLMREHDLQPKRRRRFVATTDSDHDNPIFPDLARDRIVDRLFTVFCKSPPGLSSMGAGSNWTRASGRPETVSASRESRLRRSSLLVLFLVVPRACPCGG